MPSSKEKKSNRDDSEKAFAGKRKDLNPVRPISPEVVMRELSLSLLRATSVDEVLQIVLEAAQELVPLKKGAVLLIDEQTQELVARKGIGVTGSEGDWVGRFGEGITGYVAKHGKSRYAPDVQAEEDYIPVQANIRCEFAVPLMHDGHTIGVLDVASTRKRGVH